MSSATFRPTVLLYCEHTAGQHVRSGIQRVVVEAALALSGRCNLRFVKWDRVDGQLRDLDARGLENLFGDHAHRFLPHPTCHKVNYRFVDTVEHPEQAWLLYPEISYFIEGGAGYLAAMRAQCREAGIRSAAIFYDLIPVLEGPYQAGKALHLEYLVELLQCDRIFAISQFSADSLTEYVTESADLPDDLRHLVKQRVVAAPLGEYRVGESWGLPHDAIPSRDEPTLIMVGTIEPRKQQVILLKALNDARRRNPVLDSVRVEIFGSLHPDSAHALHAEIKRNPRITYHNYASDAEIEKVYNRAWFSAFVSDHEGYGLPIVESLRRGVPCLTTSYGAMAEVASGGGCLTVNAKSEKDIAAGVMSLLTDVDLLEKLRVDIGRRPKRSWGDYADQLLGEFAALDEENAREEAALAKAVAAVAGKRTKKSVVVRHVTWTVAGHPGALSGLVADRAGGKSAIMLVTDQPYESRYDVSGICACDILAFATDMSRQSIISAANEAEIEALLPPAFVSGADYQEQAVSGCVALSKIRGRALQVAVETDLRRHLLKKFGPDMPQVATPLAIVLSTYNRGPFVEHNVEWILGLIDQDRLPVRCVVVDNASTDDTVSRLARFAGHPAFTLVQNANNVGMLGNLRICAAGHFAPYVWLTGDDDFIVPGRIQAVLQTIADEPGLPLLVHNFSVYHRAQFSPTDHASQFMTEQIRLAPEPEPTGVYPVNAIAGAHDNLFTAIYPLVFRADVLSACFDYPFTGVPFGDLTECVPTTKLILGSYRYSDAYWFEDVGIVGNAHNSWSSHRPRWHLVLMPAVLQLAHAAGVDAGRVWQWLQIHKTLFAEAIGISVEQGHSAHIDLPEDAAFAQWCFRDTIALHERLRLSPPETFQQWSVTA